MVPASSVKNDKKSGFAPVVNVGATPPDHLIPLNHELVTAPPLVYSTIIACTRGAGAGLDATHVTVPAPDALTTKKLEPFRFNVTVVPPGGQ